MILSFRGQELPSPPALVHRAAVYCVKVLAETVVVTMQLEALRRGLT